jgi:hypothetical protein
VLNATGSDEVFFRVDGVNPTVDGAGCYYLPQAIGSLGVDLPFGDSTDVVKVISSGTPKVAVRGL